MTISVVTGRVISDNTGVSIEMPVLLSHDGPVQPLIDYILSKRRSLAWQEKTARAVKLFLEYLEVNAIKGEEEWRLFRNFSTALHRGTINPETLDDPSGLYWLAIPVREANNVIQLLSDFFDWLGNGESPPALKFNPHYTGTKYDQRIDWQAYQYRRNKAFLGHVWSEKPKESQGRLIRAERPPKVFNRSPPMFPEERFEELLFKGFKVAGKYDYRGMLITLMLFGGGLRVSEPFHLFMADVQPHWDDPSKAFVVVHHPSLGYAPNQWTNQRGHRGSRQEYLAAEFGLVPRHLVRGKLHAGWKHPALDAQWYMQIHWFPVIYGQWFMQIWTRYMEQVALLPRHHPYAWVNIYREPLGGIYMIGQYHKALQAAVERIGLVFGKTYGTTPHGPRHAYAQRARRGGIDPIIIQRIMHHCSPESHLIYTKPALKEVAKALDSAAQQIAKKSKVVVSISQLLDEI